MGGSCEGNIKWKDVAASEGWYRISDRQPHPPKCLLATTPTSDTIAKDPLACVFEKCLYSSACLGEKNTNESVYKECNAEEGFANLCTDVAGKDVRCRLCGTCREGYKRTGSGTKCKKCPDPIINKILLGVGLLVMLLGSSIMIWMEITSETSKEETSDAIKRIILNFLQIVSLAGGLPLQWPTVMNIMFDSFATLSSAGKQQLYCVQITNRYIL